MTDIEKSKDKFSTSKTTDEKKKAATFIRDLWIAFTKEMLEHLAEEERVLIPLMRSTMTSKEHDALIDKILATMGLSGNALMLPWIERSMRVWRGDAETVKFMSVIPAPIRFLHSLEGDKPPSESSSLSTAIIVVGAAVAVAGYFYWKS